MTTPKERNFKGHRVRDCGEHRSVGSHRAWCHDCTEWCYPEAPCKGCELPNLKNAFRELAEELRKRADEADREFNNVRVDYSAGDLGGFRERKEALLEAAQMVEERLK